MTSTTNDEYRREDSDGIITVTFTRDQKLNAVSDAMVDALRDAVVDLADDEAQRALVITAEGRYFTAGKDIGQMGAQPTSGVALRRNYRRLHELFDEMERIEKPIVLAAQGPCLGVGVEIAHPLANGDRLDLTLALRDTDALHPNGSFRSASLGVRHAAH